MLDKITTRIFADGANLQSILELADDPRISGFTTNPTLMHQAGVTDYARFAAELLSHVTTHPVSFEAFADERENMRRQAKLIASWGENVYVKIPVTTTSGEPMTELVHDLSHDGVKVNVTAMFTLAQVEGITAAVAGGAPSYLSIFAGRIADAGVDPVPLVRRAVEIMAAAPGAECMWASPPRGPQPRPGEQRRLPYHHDDTRSAPQARRARQGPFAVLARDRPDVLPGRGRRRLLDLAVFDIGGRRARPERAERE